MLYVLLSVLSAPAQTLTAGPGSCPGPNTFQVRGMTPLGVMGAVTGSPGSSTIPAGWTCAGTVVPLTNMRHNVSFSVDGAGNVDLDVNVPAGKCEDWAVVVDANTCVVTNAVQLGGG